LMDLASWLTLMAFSPFVHRGPRAT
jgi:hypothetical protein